MNIDTSKAISFENSLIQQPLSGMTIRLIGHCDKLFVDSPLRVEHIYKKTIEREHQEHRGVPEIDSDFQNMLSGVRISATPSFELSSYFHFHHRTYFKKSQMSSQEILAHLRANDFGYMFFTPEEAHQVAAKIARRDVLCKREQPVIIFYKYPKSSPIFYIWMFRDKRNRLHICNVNHYVSGFKLPSVLIIFTRDNVLIPEEEIPEGGYSD